MLKVTIIVPVYNVELYIEKCVLSLMNQSYENIEIILIDDGSTDNSGNICDALKIRDGRIKVFHNQNNGVSHARNCGILNSTGDYIAFVDSDDWVDRKYIEKLVGVTKFQDYDLIICRYYTEDFVRDRLIEHKFRGELKGAFNVDYYSIAGFIGGPVFKLYKSDLIRKNKIFFPEDMRYSEDRVFNHKYYHYVKEYIFVDEPLYYYASRNNNSLSKVRSYDNYKSALYELRLLCNFLDKHNVMKRELILGDAVINTITDFSDCFVTGGYKEFLHKINLLLDIISNRILKFSSSKKEKLYYLLNKKLMVCMYFYLLYKHIRYKK